MFASFLHDEEWLRTQELLQRHRWPEAVQNKNTVSLSPRLILLSTCQSLEQNPLLRKQKFKFLSVLSKALWGLISICQGSPSIFPSDSSQRLYPSLLYASHTSALVFILPKAVTETSISPHNFLCFYTKAVLKVWLPGHRLPRPSAPSSSDTLQSPMLSNFLQ